ncbi:MULTISPECIES: cupin [unclassified Ruegeria]|uniref:cupin n=1 Tax=unclassified Ruegeria TaxID=2625375 RepID=UPI0014879367|nr:MULTISPECIES: cupin [unclassified Ruegeria]NOD36920.1 cupin [Ruegeria sp. HKCCD7296]NOD48106.1 cupin [Ruegeria sp. HKCCD5849]NOD53467.1 cupin [Ruegeria sp. HKCCD5851]NOD70055.1 cupin [Ruegeria sp. HKCCD7303]NOE35907.1 cupin [Ruegeria sp. HKCCD7318]
MKDFNHYAGEAGESHRQDVEAKNERWRFALSAQAIEFSEPVSYKNPMFLRIKSVWNETFHVMPAPQGLMNLTGVIRVSANESVPRDIITGDV